MNDRSAHHRRRRQRAARRLTLACLGAAPTYAAAQSAPVYHVTRTTESIALDARMSEPAWNAADSVIDLRQREPGEGTPASERTVIKMVRDADRLYVAVRAYDRDMARVRASQRRRDADLSSDDNVMLLIDSYHDRRSAFFFATNPNGAMWDAQMVGFTDYDDNWNGIWDVATRRDSVSWTAEFAIPLRTLRFHPGNDVIGVNVRRFIRRKNEEVLWQSWGRAQGIDNLLYTADVAGFADVPSDRPIELRPYALGRSVMPSFDPFGARVGRGSIDGKVGIDAKLGVSPTLTADLTVNTDFAQVEADSQIINLTRFPTFFPEKREFFLESKALFDFGTPERIQLFYSRRVGLDTAGVPVPMLGGARVYGKAGDWTLGALGVRTGGSENATDVAIRVGRDFLDRSTIAGMVVDRTAHGLSERGAGVDVDVPLVVGGHNIEPHVWLMGTRTPSVAGTPLAWRISTDYPNDAIDTFASLYSIDDGFSPAMGFVRRTGVWETVGHLDYTPRPGFERIRKFDVTPLPAWDILADRTRGDLTKPSTWETADFIWHIIAAEMQSGEQFSVNVVRDLDAPTEGFDIFRGVTIPAGRYWWTSYNAGFTTSAGRPLGASLSLGRGDFYDGTSRSAEVSGTYRGGGHLIASAGYSVTSARLPAGTFTATQLNSHLEYNVTARAGLLGFFQFQNEDRRTDFNLRFHWIPTIGDDVFVVWNSGFSTDPDAAWRFPSRRALSHPLNGAFVVKVAHRLTP